MAGPVSVVWDEELAAYDSGLSIRCGRDGCG